MSDYKYNAFISYSHDTEFQLAVTLKNALKKFAKPWGMRSKLRIYRDTSSQDLTSDLMRDVKQAMDASNYFILMASPGSKQSDWVTEEVEYWLKTKSIESLLIVLCRGTIVWDKKKKDFY